MLAFPKTVLPKIAAALAAVVLLAGCFQDSVFSPNPNPPAPQFESATMRVRMNLSAVNSLKKGSTISLSKMIVVMTSNATSPDTVRDTLRTFGTTPTISATSTTQQTINKTYALKALRAWKVYVSVRDARDSLVHFDSASTPALAIGDTATVNLGLTSRFAMYDATFLSLPDSISAASGNVKQVLRVDRLVLKIDGVALRDSLATPGPYFDSLTSHTLGYDYVSTSAKSLISSGTSSNLNAVHFPSSVFGFMVGAGGTARRTTNSGSSWIPMTVPSGTKALRSVYFVDANVGYIVGDSTTLRTTDGGVNWLPQTTMNPNTPLIASLKSVFYINASTGWAISGSIFKTTDAGVTWNLKAGVPSAFSVRFADANTGWVAGSNSTSTIRKSTDGGETWNTQTVPSTKALKSIYPVNTDLVYAVGDTGTILRTTNGGANWFAQTTGVPASNLKSVYFLDAAVGYAVGDNGTILATSDSGNNWAVQSSPVTANLTSIHFVGTKAYVVGESGTLFSLTGPRLVTLEVYGPMGDWNTANPLFSGSKYVNVAAGADATIPLTLKWVGPTGGTGSISATLGKVGKVTINGTLPGTILP